MPFASHRRRFPDDVPPGQQWTDRTPTRRMSRPVAGDQVPPDGGPSAAPPAAGAWATSPSSPAQSLM